MKFKILAKGEFDEWNEFVHLHPNGTIFHQTQWLERIGQAVEVLLAEEKNKIMGGIAYVKTKKNGVVGLHIPPYTHYFGPLFDHAHLNRSKELLTQIIKTANHRHLDFKLHPNSTNILPYHTLGFECSAVITHIVSGSLKNYLEQLNKNKLRELRKLQQEVRHGTLKVYSEYEPQSVIALMKRTGHRGRFEIKENLFKRVFLDGQPNFLKGLYIESKEHGLVSFGIFAKDKKCVYNLINASLRINHPIYKTINLLTVYNGIEFALKHNLVFDFEGSMIPGVANFYRLMGGKETLIYRMQKSTSMRYSLLRAGKQIINDRKKT